MAGTPYLIAEGNEANGTLTLILNVATATSAGDVIFVAAQTGAGAGSTITSVTDSKGNTYTAIDNDAAQITTYQFETTNSPTTALTTSDTITITYPVITGAKAGVAVGLPGYQSGHDVAPTPVDGASSTSSSISSGTLGQANEVVMAVVSEGAQATGPTWGAGWTQVGVARQASNPWLSVAYKIVSSTASVTATASWPNLVKYCTLLASYKVPATPPPSGLYFVGQASAASGGSASLSVPITNATGAGDTITVGALATAGSVTGVTDSAGNLYGLVQSETTNTGCQLYTFEAYNTDVLTPGSGFNPHAGRVGCTSNFKSYRFLYTAVNSSTTGCVFTIGNTVQHSLPNGTKVKFMDGTPPGGFVAGTTYYVINSSGTSFSSTGTSFKLAASPGGAAIGSTGNGSGNQTFQLADGTYAYTELSSAQEFDSNLDSGGFTAHLATGSTGSQKLYFSAGSFPQSFTDDTGQDLTTLMATGVQVWLCLAPNPNGSDATAMHNMLQWWITNGTNVYGNRIKVVFFQEYGGQTQTNFINAYRNYYSVANALGIKVIYDAAGSGGAAKWTSWYPGNAFCDEIALDYYGSVWNAQTHGGTTNLDPTLPMRQLADNNGKPFGFGEIGQAVWNAGAHLSDALFIPYIQYITNIMSARLAPGAVNSGNSDVMWYNGYGAGTTYGGNGNALLPGDWRIPYLQTLWNSLTSPVASGITVTYSGNTSNQAAIVTGDSNVQSGDDKAVGATATTGTTASVATGVLGQSEEHIIAFVGDLAAGGSPTLGDGLTAASTGVQAGTGPFLKAGFKAVNSTASDTPSATLGVSTTWSISAITHKLTVPVVNGPGPGTAFVGVAFSYTASATGGTGTLTWSSTGTLPTGLSFSSLGALTGTPTTAGTYVYQLVATDSLGLQGTFSVTQQVILVGPGTPTDNPAPPTALPGNLISLADSGSESSTGYTWASFNNASTPTRTTTNSVEGSFATSWNALAAGDTQIATGLYPVNPNEPHVASCYLLTNQSLLADVGIAWYDITQTLIATVSLGNALGTVANGWTPLTFATVSPGTAAFASLVVDVPGASAGQAFSMDLAYLAESDAQILIDWNNPTFDPGGSAGQLFMDVTPFVRYDSGHNITYTRGRQDAISQVQPGSASFSLQNDLGSFARFSSISLPGAIGGAVSLQCRSQINLADETGQFWTRFDGSIAQITYEFDTTGNTSLANITLTDVLSNLNRQDPLFCWTKSQVLSDNPEFHWSLNDPGNTGGTGRAGLGAFGTAAETSGSNGPPMRLFNTDGTAVATIKWQDTTGGVETLADAVAVNQSDGSEYWTAGLNQPSNPVRGLDSGTVGPFTTPIGSVYLTPVLTAQSAQNQFTGNNGYYLQAELPQALATNDPTASYAFECWFTMDPQVGAHLASNYGPYIPLSFGSSRQKACFVAGLFLNAGALQFKAAVYNQPPSFLGLNWPGTAPPSAVASTSKAIAPDLVQRPHHLLLNVLGKSAQAIVQVYLDGALVGNVNLNHGQVIDTVTIGAAYGGAGAHYGGVQLASVYPSALSQQQITLHAQLGQYGMWESPSDDALAQVAGYAGVPSFWSNLAAQHNGLSLLDYMDITGSNALTTMQLIAQAENGLLFVDATGALNFHTRDWRMGYGAPDLLLPPESFSPVMNFELIDQFMCNEMGVAGPGTTGASATQGTVISTNTGAIAQQTSQVASANIQAGYINDESQEQYGVYAPSPVSSPISLPLITWSRAYAQLGIPSLTYWPDPNLLDIAAWSSNSRSDPWVFPAQLQVDLLTLDSNDVINTLDSQGNPIQVPIGISTFYALEIDNMVAPAALAAPQSMPNETGSLEWFIEGISETVNVNSRTMTMYVSPAEAQRCWIPGDPVYGVLGSTTRLGISQSDLSTPQADGKDVSHDAGPPYWPPTFSAGMNNPDGSGNAFVGAGDMRGILSSLQLVLQPPMCVVSAISQTQSFANGALSNPAMNWDTIHVDTTGGMGLYPGWPNWYVCTVPGFYDISASLAWAVTNAQAGYLGQGWVAVARQAAQALGAGTGTPLTVGKYICPVGEAVRWNGASTTPFTNATERIYLGLGDMVALCGEHNYTSAHSSSTGSVGSHMSIRFAGLSSADDRTEINSSLSVGGTVSLVTNPSPTVAIYANTHTYSYEGAAGGTAYGRRNTDNAAFQGQKGTTQFEGSQTAQIAFNAALIASQLNTHTITSATLQCQNLTSWYPTGTKLMLGYTTQTPGGASYQPATATDTLNVFHQKFTVGENLTFAIPISIVQAFVSAGATALVIGDSVTTNLNYYGSWKGGPGNWTLTVRYQ